MIISHRHKFIFIKTHKTASTSIEIALSSICGKNDVITPISPEDEKIREELGYIGKQNIHIDFLKYSLIDFMRLIFFQKRKKFRRHMGCEEVKNNISSAIWNSYYKFSFERNPFDKMVSLYFWRNGVKEYGNFYSFLTKSKLDPFDSYSRYTLNGKIAVDRVYQYEKLDFFLRDFSKKIGLEQTLHLPEYRAKSNTREIKNYKNLLDPKSIEFIKTRFAKEIELFDYKYA